MLLKTLRIRPLNYIYNTKTASNKILNKKAWQNKIKIFNFFNFLSLFFCRRVFKHSMRLSVYRIRKHQEMCVCRFCFVCLRRWKIACVITTLRNLEDTCSTATHWHNWPQVTDHKPRCKQWYKIHTNTTSHWLLALQCRYCSCRSQCIFCSGFC